jgi:membrane-associated phospholipid phosphatase
MSTGPFPGSPVPKNRRAGVREETIAQRTSGTTSCTLDRADRMNGLRNWSLGLLATAIAVTVSYRWLDRPIAQFAHDQLQHFHLFEKLTHIADALTPLAIVAFVILGLRGLTVDRLSRFQTVVLLSGVTLAVAVIVKDQLKFAFGRPWPETWMRNNTSFIRDGLYGFYPFHGGGGYASFPSGHTTMICTVMTVLWICYPRFRPLYALCMAAVAIGLVGANFHFLSDVIAGAFLGISAGWLGVSLWEMGERQVRPQASSDTTDDPCRMG